MGLCPLSTLAVIPARGGSKGIPRKNLSLVAGLPLVAHAIRAASAAQSVGRVIVSTDDAQIGSVAAQHGAEVVWRPVELATDDVSSEAALLHALDYLRTAEDYSPELLVFIQCTAPLTSSADIDGTVRALIDECADSALAVAEFHSFVWGRDKQGRARGINHMMEVRSRRQDRDPQYLETGGVYVMRTEAFLRTHHRFCGSPALYVVPANCAIEIDEPDDLSVAEALLTARRTDAPRNHLPDSIDALVLDFDGVMTDNRVLAFDSGEEAVVCNRSDGYGIELLRAARVPMLVLSKERHGVVAARCEKLQLELRQSIDQKLDELRAWASARGVNLSKTIYVGNDVNDIECMTAVGCAIAVADAHPLIKEVAHIVLKSDGGAGAVREVCDLILEKLGRHQ